MSGSIAFSSPCLLEELEKELLEALPPLDASPCECILMETTVTCHLDDCVLRLFDSDEFSCASSGSASPSEDRESEKRRKHRESMARLRQSWRSSIAGLERRQKQLERALRQALNSQVPSPEAVDRKQALHQAYCQLVHEQVRLQDEQANLEAACADREKYKRMIDRELERTRTFLAVVSRTETAVEEARDK